MEKTNPTVNHETFRRKTVEKCLRILSPLDDDSRFVLENSVNGIDHSTTHVMYKLVPPQLELVDGRKYEFLIEFDRDDIEWSIYYGCRGLFPDMDPADALTLFDKEFEEQRQYILKDLRMIGLDVDDDSFEITNNISNHTYWPFWLKMTGNLQSTVSAVIAIRASYENYLLYKGLITEDKRTYPDEYENLLWSVDEKSRFLIREFIDNMVLEDLFEKLGYRNEWKLKKDSNTDFAHLWRDYLCCKDVEKKNGKKETICLILPNKSIVDNKWFPKNHFSIWEVPRRFFYGVKGKPMPNLAKTYEQWKRKPVEPKSSGMKRIMKKLRRE